MQIWVVPLKKDIECEDSAGCDGIISPSIFIHSVNKSHGPSAMNFNTTSFIKFTPDALFTFLMSFGAWLPWIPSNMLYAMSSKVLFSGLFSEHCVLCLSVSTVFLFFSDSTLMVVLDISWCTETTDLACFMTAKNHSHRQNEFLSGRNKALTSQIRFGFYQFDL